MRSVHDHEARFKAIAERMKRARRAGDILQEQADIAGVILTAEKLKRLSPQLWPLLDAALSKGGPS